MHECKLICVMIREFGDVLIEGGGGGGGGASGSEELGIYGLLLILTEATSKRGGIGCAVAALTIIKALTTLVSPATWGSATSTKK